MSALLPLVDMLNHRNGEWTNVNLECCDSKNRRILRSTRAIEVGEQLLMTYMDLETMNQTDGAPLFFKQFGFVEQRPSLWSFAEELRPYAFVLWDDDRITWRYADDDDGNIDVRQFQADARAFLSRSMAESIRLESEMRDSEDLQPYWRIAREFRSAFEAAVTMALTAVERDGITHRKSAPSFLTEF